VLETWIFSVMLYILPNPPNTSAVAGIGRMFRLLRLARISKLMQIIPELVTMVKGMIAALRAVHAALLILLLLVYVTSLIMNALVGGEEELQEYFPTVRDAMITLIVQGIFLDEITGLVRSLISAGEVLATFVFAVFVLLSALTVMNMLIGVLCQVVLDVSAQEKEQHVKTQIRDTLLVMLQELDDDKSGEISKSEFQSVFNDPQAIAVMKSIQVDTQHLMDLSEMLYEKEDSTLPISVIMHIVLTLRGERTVTMDDLGKAQNFVMWALDAQLSQYQGLASQLAQGVFPTPDKEVSSAQAVAQ